MHSLRLLVEIFSLSLRRDLAFRANFIISVLQSSLAAATVMLTIGALYRQTDDLAGWTRADVVVLFGTFLVVNGLMDTFVQPNVSDFARRIMEGTLDDALVRPVPDLLTISLGNHAPLGLIQVVLGAATLGSGIADLAPAPHATDYALWLVLLGCGLLIAWSTRVGLSLIALWSPAASSEIVYSAVWQTLRYPPEILARPMRIALATVLPLTFVVSVPTRALTTTLDWRWIGASLVLAPATAYATSRFWQIGIRRYTGVTS